MTAQKYTRSNPMEPVPFRIDAVREEPGNCFTVTLIPPETKPYFAFKPGQFNMLYAFGHGEVPISVSGDMANPEKLVHTIRNVGSVTAALQKLKPGDTVGVRGPFGSAWPLEKAKGKDVMLMAGGLGLAPLRPAIYYLRANRKDYGKLTLLYGTRAPDTLLFADELATWEKEFDIGLTVDSAGSDWHGHVGVVTDLLFGREINHANTIAMLCGPEIMMRFCAHALLDKGIPSGQVYVSMERNMKCAINLCGRCQYGPFFICKDGPVFPFDRVERLFKIREV